MQIHATPTGSAAELLAPAGDREPKEGKGAPHAPNAAAEFTALLALLVGAPATTAAPEPAADAAAPEPTTLEATAEGEVTGEPAVLAPAETGARPVPGTQVDGAPATHGEVDALHYGLRTDRELGTLADALKDAGEARESAPRRGNARSERAIARGLQHAAGKANAHAAVAALAEGEATRQGDATADATRDAEHDAATASLPNASDRLAATPGEATAAATGAATAAAATAAADHARRTLVADARHVVRDTDALQPELQERLDRVVSRMRDEFGHDVQVVETQRSQARQDALFAQGRSAPGPVVTWTRSSQHTAGRAVDVMIDGGYDDAEAFRTLQRVAREEGLHTLGMKDPGHLELPRGIGRTSQQLAANRADASSDALPNALPNALPDASRDAAATLTRPLPAARVAPQPAPQPDAAVARVADVAVVAQVAEVAAVAVPGASANATPAPRRPAASDRAADAPGQARAASRLAVNGYATRGARPNAGRADRDGAESSGGQGAGAQAQAQPQASAPGQLRTEAAPPVLGADAVSRVHRVTDAQDAARANVSHLTIRVDNAAGGEDQIRVNLRGLSVDAAIDVGDATSVDRLTGRVGELRQALERHGLTTDTVRISAAGQARADLAPDASRLAAASGVQAAASAGAGDAAGSGTSQQQSGSPQRDARDAQQAMQREQQQQQHGQRDGRRGQGAEPWLADDQPPFGRARRGVR